MFRGPSAAAGGDVNRHCRHHHPLRASPMGNVGRRGTHVSDNAKWPFETTCMCRLWRRGGRRPSAVVHGEAASARPGYVRQGGIPNLL